MPYVPPRRQPNASPRNGEAPKQRTPARLETKAFKEYGYWGAGGANPSFCVSAFRVTRGKLLVRVAAKYFLDLCNVNQAEFIERPPFVILKLLGGDASEGFTAEFTVHGVNLIERVVREGEFPQAFERTRFNYPFTVD